MRSPLFLTSMTLLVALSVGEARSDVPPLSPQAVRTWEAMSGVRSLEADFVQTRTTRLLSQPLESRGVLRFQRPDSMAWTVESPARSTFVMQGSQVGMYFPDLQVREEIDLGSSPETAQLVEGMMVWLAGDLERVQRDYTVSWTDGSPAQATLVPKDERLSRIMSRIELGIAGEPPQIQAVRIVEPDGDEVAIRLENIRTDVTLAPEAFKLP